MLAVRIGSGMRDDCFSGVFAVLWRMVVELIKVSSRRGCWSMIIDRSGGIVEYLMGTDEEAPVPAARVVERHAKALMALPQVTGVGVGADLATGTPVVAVYVTRKLPREQLAESDVIPSVLDGIPVTVTEIGAMSAGGEP